MPAVPQPLTECNFGWRLEAIEIMLTIGVSVQGHHQSDLARHVVGDDAHRTSDANLGEVLSKINTTLFIFETIHRHDLLAKCRQPFTTKKTARIPFGGH